MAKAKVKKTESKEKGILPVTVAEYETAVLMVKLLSKIKKEFAKRTDITDVHFMPKLNGYQVLFKEGNNGCKINIEKRKLLSGYAVQKYVDGFKKVSVTLKSAKEYEDIVEKLFGHKTEKTKLHQN